MRSWSVACQRPERLRRYRANVSTVTQSEWEAELRALRSDLGPLATMLMRWRWKAHLQPGASVVDVVTGLGVGHDLTLSLYSANASSGDRPVVDVEVQPDSCIETFSQPGHVMVAGTPSPGHAVVVVVGDHEFWPVYPCTLSLRSPRL